MMISEFHKAKFLEKIFKTDSCWRWSGSVDRNGYGRMSVGHVNRTAHRISYELFKGSIPEGLQIDHLCRVRDCVNPDHLEAVTGRMNTLRGYSPSAIHARKTHCPRGHEYSPTYDGRRWRRYCKTCYKNSNRLTAQKYRAKKSAIQPPNKEEA